MGPEEEGDRLNVDVADMMKSVGKLEDKQQQEDIAVGDILMNLEDRKDIEVLEGSLLEGSLLEGSSLEDSSLEDNRVLNIEELQAHLDMMELKECVLVLLLASEKQKASYKASHNKVFSP